MAPDADDDDLDNLDNLDLDPNHSGLGLDEEFEPDAALLPSEHVPLERSNPF